MINKIVKLFFTFALTIFLVGISGQVLADCNIYGTDYFCNILCPTSPTDDSWAASGDVWCCTGWSCTPSDNATVIAAAKSAYDSYYQSLWPGFGGASGTVTLKSPITDASGNGVGLEGIIKNVTGFIFWLGLVICPIIIVWAGFNIATAGDDQNKVKQGKDLITYAVIGLLIIAISNVMVTAVQSVLK